MLQQYFTPEFYLQPLAGGLVGAWRRLGMNKEMRELDRLVNRAINRHASHYTISAASNRTDAYVWVLSTRENKSVTHDINLIQNAVRDVIGRNNYEHQAFVVTEPLRVEVKKPEPDPVALLSYTKQLDKLSGEYLFSPGVRQVVSKHVVHTMSLSDPKLPHFLLGATTGAGKTMMGTGTLATLAYLNSPERLSLLVIDPKVIDIGNSAVARLPHLAHPVITDPAQAVVAIERLAQEMAQRKEEGRQSIIKKEEWNITNRIFCYIDEIAEILEYEPKAKFPLIALAREGRGLGISLMAATQRPSASSFDTTLRSLLPVRIGGYVRDSTESDIVMGISGANLHHLPGTGLFRVLARDRLSDVQGWYIPKKDLTTIVDSTIKKWKGAEPAWRLPVEPSRFHVKPVDAAEKPVVQEDTRLFDAVVELVRQGNEPSLNRISEMRQELEGKGMDRPKARGLLERAREMANAYRT